jgi:hypothetical protein
MIAQPCLPRDIFEVNRNKEYTLISTELLESVLTDTNLNAQTSKLWQILFNKARYNPNFEVKISYSYLAKKLGKSTRTIARYVESLQNAGYLIIKHNFDKNGGQRPSTILVRVPTVSIEHAKKKKDRVNKKCSLNNETLVTINKNGCDQLSGDFIEEHTTSITTSQSHSRASTVLCETINNANDVQTLGYHYSEKNPDELDVKSKDTSLPPQETFSPLISKEDKNDMGGDDINVIQKDNNKKETHNNNNVVSFFPEEDQITKINNEIEVLEKQLLEGNKKIIGIKDHSLLYDQIKKNSQTEALLYLTKNTLERVQKEIDKKAKQDKANANLTDNPRFMLDKEGGRAMPLFTFKRLVKSLQSYGYYGNMLHTIINEIVFEVRFGSLIYCSRTKMPLSFDNGINIALKLVREKRWSSPVLLKI